MTMGQFPCHVRPPVSASWPAGCAPAFPGRAGRRARARARARAAGWAREDARRCAAGRLTGDHVGHRGLVQEHPGHHALLVCCHRRGPSDRQARHRQPGLLLPLARSLPLSLPDMEAIHCHLLFPRGSRNWISLFGQFIFLISVLYTA